MIEELRDTLEEMKRQSGPDREADYWDERRQIERYLKQLNDVNAELPTLKENYEKVKEDL